jgi:hypothetical protein
MMEFKPTLKRILLNTIWGLLNLIIWGTAIIFSLIDRMFWAIGFFLLLSGLFVVIPAILHFNYWAFDKDTEFQISKESFKLKNRTTNKEINGQANDIKKIFRVETQANRVPWMHEYTVIKMNDGKTFKISNYVIDPGEIIEILGLKKIVTTRDIFVPTIQSGTVDKELRRL